MSREELRLGFDGNEKRVVVDLREGMPEPWDLDTELHAVGKDHPRIDGVAKVTGRAEYSYDKRFDDLIYAKHLRSPHAAAKVKSVDLSRAKALKGVLYTESYEGAVIRYAGQRVAGVAATSEEVLDDALALIEVEYEVLPHVVTVEDAMKDRAPQVLSNAPNVREGRAPQRRMEQVEAAHGEADVVVEAEYSTQVQTHSCLETHGCVCKWDGDKVTVWASTQATFAFKFTIARSLGVPVGNVTVITEHMGGGFGSKFGADSWDVLCGKAARETGRPCRYLLDRKEEHLIAGNRPSSIQKCKFSARRDGTLMGAGVESWGTSGVGRGAGVYNPAIYRFRATYSRQRDVYTNAGGGRAFRAPRHPQGVFALEGMIDELAEAVRMDPLAFRKKNDPHPVRQAQYDIGAEEIGWQNRKKSGSGKGPVKRGLGMAATRWGHNAFPGRRGMGSHGATCRIEKDGSVLMANGAQDIGTGTRTVIAVIAAEELGLRPGDVDVRLGHTTDPMGPPSGGSQTAPSLAPVVRDAAWQAKRRLLDAVAAAVGGDATKMDLRNGKVAGAPKPITFKQACSLIEGVLEVNASARPEHYALQKFTNEVAGVQFADVEVDTETGAVRVKKVVAVQDCGIVVDPLLARSQINGGVVQGISYALFENRWMDRRTGAMNNPNLLDYKIAGAMDTPEIVPIAFNVAQGQTTTGVSSLGEPPTVATAGAIANAVANAIGARVRSLPITPDKVLNALGAIR